MAIPTIIYCDPSIDADTGDGTLAAPYGRYGYMLAQMTFDGTNGNFLAIKQGTNIIGSDWTLPSGTNTIDQLSHVVWDGENAFDPEDDPTLLTPVTFDGGNADTPIFDHWGGNNHQKTWINWRWFNFTNCGAAALVECYNQMHFLQCGFYDNSGGGVLAVGSGNHNVMGCFFSNVGGSYVASFTHGHFIGNYVYASDAGSTHAFRIGGCGSALHNVFDINGTSAIYASGATYQKLIANNTIVQRAKGTIRDGVWFTTSIGASTTTILNNVFIGQEHALNGWIGTYDVPTMLANSFYDCKDVMYGMDAIHFGNVPAIGHSDNEIVESDPIKRTGSRPMGLTSMSDRFAYYQPNDIGRMVSGGFPFGSGQHRGAVPPAAGGGDTMAAYNRGRIDALRQLGTLR
ncbi:hypothetical protein [Roseimaritima ulvae]|uniref:Right handed beta helix domain-containing protein n=1 Tax=Roseimaritima ulvae TaxID=980254 RepID=A0A5B9R2G1_9BACT|nr:hypothetical protein [Roseimaritima ulvae]QEG40441.1 hypothetical protein UC8_24530 [Roseimaritima ulvae]